MKTLIIIHSYHHNNTQKIAKTMAEVLGADIMTTEQAKSNELGGYDLVGFGAGIDSGMHYRELLDFAEAIVADDSDRRGFVFSTSAVQGENKVAKDHKKLRGILKAKGYDILGEYSCKGHNTNSFLKYIGGMNNSHPDATDMDNARQFATGVMDRM